MRCQLSRLQKGHATDEWFQLSSYVPLKGIEPGSLRVRARYSMEKIMPEEEYNEFKEVWTDVYHPWFSCQNEYFLLIERDLSNTGWCNEIIFLSDSCIYIYIDM